MNKTPYLANNKKVIVYGLIGTISLILAIRMFNFISKFAVNIFYSDQWDFYTPFFGDYNIWQVFTWQHGPHRQGIGLLITGIIASLTGWDSRYDSYAILVFIIFAFISAMYLKKKLFGYFEIYDIIIPLLFFTLFQHEGIVVVPNLSYAALPLFMIMLYCIGLFFNNEYLRYSTILGLNFLLIYTGFGFFAGILTIILLITDVYQNINNKNKSYFAVVSLFIAIISLMSFFISYKFDPAIPNFGISVQYIMQYPLFAGMMLATFFGFHISIFGALVHLVGVPLLITLIAVCVVNCRKLFSQGVYSDKTSLIVVLLVGFSLLFCLNAAIGRTPLGLEAAQANRYLTLLIPAFLGLYFYLLTLRKTKFVRFVLSIYLVASLSGSLPIDRINNLGRDHYVDKMKWKSCYLNYEDVDKCNQLVANRVFSGHDPGDLSVKLHYLKNHRLNLFLDSNTK